MTDFKNTSSVRIYRTYDECPELREVIYLLECMDDEDIQDVINKGKTAYGSNKDTERRDK